MAFESDKKNPSYNRQAPQSQPNPTGLKTQEVPDIFNPHWVSEENAKSPGLGALRNFLGNAQTMFGEANIRRSLPDVYQTQAANERDIETLVGKIENKVFDGVAPTRRALADGKANIQSSIDSIGALKPDPYTVRLLLLDQASICRIASASSLTRIIASAARTSVAEAKAMV